MVKEAIKDKHYEELIEVSRKLNKWNKVFAVTQYEYTTTLNYFRQLKNRGIISDKVYDEMQRYRVKRSIAMTAKEYQE